MRLPRALLLDLDDTILNDSEGIADCWKDACSSCGSELGDVGPELVYPAIEKTRAWFWADAARHREGRLDLDAAAREIVRISLDGLGAPDPAVATKIAARYRAHREARLTPFPGALETLQWFRESGCRLALVTNGAAAAQRGKIARFGLGELFDAILIEGELGFGKPDPRTYELALKELAMTPADAWMVGDNLEWDVVQPQRMGLLGIWVDVRGAGLPDANGVRPDRIVRRLSELRAAE
jgi:putative hydrolase of the HAD superfamily